MAKRITMKDIAKEAGVSVATVSYVINNRTDQSISEATRNKVLQIINLFNYQPNVTAQSLRRVNGVVHVAVCLEEGQGLFFDAEFIRFLRLLTKKGAETGFVFHLSNVQEEHIENADAILSINKSGEAFSRLANTNLIPLVGVDTWISDDSIFFSVHRNYSRLKEEADRFFEGAYRFVTLEIKDPPIKEEVERLFPNALFVHNPEDLEGLEAGNYYCIHGSIAKALSMNPANRVHCYEGHLLPFVEAIVHSLQRSLAKAQEDNHHQFVV